MDDQKVIKKCQNGDLDAFRYIVERYERRAVGHAVAILGNREDALDAVQDAFMDVFRALGSFDATRPFYPWFYVLLRNRCFKTATRRPRTESIEDVKILVASSGLSEDEKLELETALFSVSYQDREIITLKYLDGFSYNDLASLLEIPIGTVMSRLFLARKRLQEKLSGGRIGNEGN